MKRRILGQRWESLKMFQNITPHFCDRRRWTRCAQIVSRYFAALSKCERRKNSLTSAFVLLWKERMRSASLKYASPLKKRAKATPFGFCLKHCLRQLRNSSPKIYSCYDRQLYSGLQISHKIVASWRGQLQGFINLAKSHESSSACCSFILARRGTFCGALILILILFCGALILRISRQILGQADRVLLQRGVGWKIGKIGTD